jgi:hypothetical protein
MFKKAGCAADLCKGKRSLPVVPTPRGATGMGPGEVRSCGIRPGEANMTKGLLGVALLAGWLGVSASAYAQGAPPGATGPACPPVPGLDGPPAPDCGPPSSAESLPPNGFSNLHPESVAPSPHFYLGVDYLRWWVRKRQVPPLATLGALQDAFPAAGGQPNTLPLLGPGSLDQSSESGVRVSAIWWCDQDHTFGIDASAFWLPDITQTRVVGGSGGAGTDLVIGRPFINVNSGLQDADPIMVSGILAGGMRVDMPRQFWGGDADLRCTQCVDIGPMNRVSFLVGARYLQLKEGIHISEMVSELPDITGAPGNVIFLQDNFATSNRFYGGQIGLESETDVGQMVLTVTGKFAAGQNLESVAVWGASRLLEPNGTQVFDATRGFLVQPTNSVRVKRTHFAVAPSLAVNLAWVFNDHFRASLGYDFVYWSHVARPGDQIDRQVNVGAIGAASQFGASPHPLMPFTTTGFWAQGISAGLQVSF